MASRENKGLKKPTGDVLKVVKFISLQENKSSLELDLLYYFLSKLEIYRANTTGAPGQQNQVNFLFLLIKFILTTYQPTTEQLASQLASEQATWNILWAIFKPGSIIYTKYFGMKKPRCIVLNAIEEKTRFNDVEYYSLNCSYINYNRKVLEKASLQLIHQLPAFSLQYYLEKATVRQNLIKCDWKFCELARTHICYCCGTVFFMKKKKPVQVNIDSYIEIDASFFHEMMSNYSCPCIEKSQSTGIDLDGAFWIDFINQVQREKKQVKNLTISDKQRSILMILAKTWMGVTPALLFDNFVAGKGLENNLTRIFQIAKHFNALLLLDEADVFLECCAFINMSKNAIVIIFLCKLEYFQGIFFLMTNCKTEFDKAILSRIHLKIRYSNLSQQQQKIIWKHFVSQACTHQGPAAINDQDLNWLATSDLNSQEICI
uniref:DUF7025 domain-containing protein n=1 Tax=Coccidioides posadasii RMSCC 3488 TaxID=454284 RepID=A0A0J6FEG1_COCPO|nr:hypothetical protein CPAG_05032 [Coccidioides posadasii RMSCC 3488]